MNLANFYDYVPIRTFSQTGDMAHLAMGLGISSWWIYIFFGYLVVFLIWQFFTRTLILVYGNLHLSINQQTFLMLTTVTILFGYFSLPGFFSQGLISFFLSATSWIAIPGIAILLWPTRTWVIHAIKSFR